MTRLRGMVLAAGYGTRMRPLTDHLPKPLLPVLGRPLLWYQSMLLKELGLAEIVINLHHMGGAIEAFVENGGLQGLDVKFSHEREILGTGGGVMNARVLLDGGITVVVNGDTLLDTCLTPLVESLETSGASAAMLISNSTTVPDENAIYTDSDGIIRRAVGFGADPAGLSRCAFLGAHALTPRVFDYLPTSGCIIRQAYINMIERGETIIGVKSGARYMDVGTPGALLKANIQMLNDNAMFKYRPTTAGSILNGGVILQKELSSHEPVYIGAGCTVPESAELGPNTILAGNNAVGDGVSASESLVLYGEAVQPGEILRYNVLGFGQKLGI